MLNIKVQSEVRELNKVQRDIMREEQRIQQLTEMRERNAFFNQAIQAQTKFNSQLAHDYKQKLKDMKEGLTGNDEVANVKYEVDAGCL